jgi:dTDP-4-dehydrorhamnose reductase
MRIAILGHKGMLGHVCKRYFSEIGYEVITIDERYDVSYPDKFFDTVRIKRPQAIINCIGLIKQKSDDPLRLLFMNSVFPLQLSIRFPETIIIHPSTDCVFSGSSNKGRYFVDTIPDPADIYGISKALGEIIQKYPYTWILRCSIIGPELVNRTGLLEWFLSRVENKKNNGDNVDNTIYGFTNHKWNGITTLEWAKCASELLTRVKNGDVHSKIIQSGTLRIYSKSEILRMIANVWRKDVEIVDKEDTICVDRSLMPMWERKPLLEQLKELYSWYYGVW